MPTPPRGTRPDARLASLAAAAALALACASEGPSPIACDADATCPTASRCLQRACVADAPPLAHVASLDGVVANDLVVLDGSRSSDPDAPGDAVVSWEWTVTALDAPCGPPAVAGTTASPPVRFACAGRYEVSLVVTDELGVRSAPARVAVDVAPRSGAPLLTAGADAAVEHRCAGAPLACRMVTPLGDAAALSAVSTVEGAAFRWTVEPPAGRGLDEARRVTFEPGPDVAAPLVRIETDGTAISGDWVFRVEARDAAGVVGAAAVRVSVRNAPPVVTETLPAFHHTLDAPTSRFSVLDAVGVAVSDPDGDPLEGRTVSARHTGDGGATFEIGDLGDRIAVSVSLPYTQPDDARFLIGGEGLERAITFAIRDVNGAETSETWPVVIGNRPPERVAAPATVSVNHSYDAAAGTYRAAATLSQWRDPDGDPLVQADATGDVMCPSYTLDAAGRVAISCSLAGGMAAVAGNFVGAHDLHQRVRDPWEASLVATVTRLEILNRPPVVTTSDLVLYAPAVQTSTCCVWESGFCSDTKLRLDDVQHTLTSFVADPDGDPVQVRLDPAGAIQVCLPPECTQVISWAGGLWCPSGSAPATLMTITATDGAASASSSFRVTRSYSL